VLAAPEKRLRPADTLEAIEIDSPSAKDLEIVVGEVVADDRHQLDFGEKRCGDCKVRRRTADAALRLSERRLDVVECNAADDQNAHSFFVPRFFVLRSSHSCVTNNEEQKTKNYLMYLPMIGASFRFVSAGI